MSGGALATHTFIASFVSEVKVNVYYIPAKRKRPHTQKTGNGSPLRQALTKAMMKAIKWQIIARIMNATTAPVQSGKQIKSCHN